ncbi:hypothetical protein LCGC14_0337030 [marine sediment metagenome]|uniref:Uncharacterized protein n=1 Tax=marine sediment metagenome TaxID=412755 RepID=A0A0F9W1W1_9ZZZZ
MIQNPYLQCLFGILTWIAIHLMIYKSEYDGSNKKFSFKLYWKKSWDNWLTAFMGGYLMYFSGLLENEAFTKLLFKVGIPQGHAILSGVFGGVILRVLIDLLKKITKKDGN